MKERKFQKRRLLIMLSKEFMESKSRRARKKTSFVK
jgi:hypothetical protein